MITNLTTSFLFLWDFIKQLIDALLHPNRIVRLEIVKGPKRLK